MPASPIRKLAPLADAAKQRGIHVFHLNIGQPDLPTPQAAIDAIRNIDRKVLEYSPSAGYRSYREKLVGYYEKFNINLTADDIIITTGGSEAVLFSFMSCLNPGDEIIVPEPAYANYMAFAISAGAKIRTIATTIEEGFSLPKVEKFEELINERTKGILICNPNNPTGRTAQPELLREIVRKCTENGVKLVVDECFNDFLIDAERHTRKDLLESNPGLIILRAYTKMYAVPGVRFGWCMTADAALIEKLYHAGQPWNVSVIAQACAVAAANAPDWVTETAKRIAEERRFLSDGLAACGLTVFPGEANFLLFRSNDTGLHEKLAEYGIMIRNCDNYRGLSAGYYRVAVKTREASKCLLNAIKLIIENG